MGREERARRADQDWPFYIWNEVALITLRIFSRENVDDIRLGIQASTFFSLCREYTFFSIAIYLSGFQLTNIKFK